MKACLVRVVVAVAGIGALCHSPAARAGSERQVGGFTVTDVRGVARPDGSFEGSGKLRLAAGPALDATFLVDGRGRLVRGTFRGELEAAGRRFRVPAGAIDATGLRWQERVVLPPPAPPVTVTCTLPPSGVPVVRGDVEVPIAGVPVRFSVALDARGRWVATARAAELALPGGGRLANVELALSEDGATGTGRLVLAGRPVDLALRVAADGAVEAAAGVPVVVPLPGGRAIELDGVTLVFGAGAGEARGRGDVRIGAVTIRDATFALGADGGVTGAGKVAVGGATIDTRFSAGPAGLILAGTTSATRQARVAGATYELAAEISVEAAGGPLDPPGVRARARGAVRRLGLRAASRQVESEIDLGSGKVRFRAFGRRFELPLL